MSARERKLKLPLIEHCYSSCIWPVEICKYLTHKTYNCHAITTKKYTDTYNINKQNNKIKDRYGFDMNTAHASGIHIILNMPGKITAAHRDALTKKLTCQECHLMWYTDYSLIWPDSKMKHCNYIKRVSLDEARIITTRDGKKQSDLAEYTHAQLYENVMSYGLTQKQLRKISWLHVTNPKY